VARRWLLVCGVLFLAAAAGFWVGVVEPARRHAAFCREVRADLQSLARKRPPTVSRKQWENVVARTLNAHGNCLTFHADIPQDEMERFAAELKRRLAGPVDLSTIDWIWDEIVRLTPGGQRYSDNWRPTLPERLREFEEGNQTWGIDVD
jgi:hypothetical protein